MSDSAEVFGNKAGVFEINTGVFFNKDHLIFNKGILFCNKAICDKQKGHEEFTRGPRAISKQGTSDNLKRQGKKRNREASPAAASRMFIESPRGN